MRRNSKGEVPCIREDVNMNFDHHQMVSNCVLTLQFILVLDSERRSSINPTCPPPDHSLQRWRTPRRFIAPSQRLQGSTKPRQHHGNCWEPGRRQCTKSITDANKAAGADAGATPGTDIEDVSVENAAGAGSGDDVDPHTNDGPPHTVWLGTRHVALKELQGAHKCATAACTTMPARRRSPRWQCIATTRHCNAATLKWPGEAARCRDSAQRHF